MNKMMRIPFLALAISIFGAGGGLQLLAVDPQTPNANWDNLKTLTPGQEIRVVLKDAKSYEGAFQSFGDNGIALRQPGGDQTLKRQEILRVSSRGKKHRGRNALIGAAVGAGVGLGLGAALDQSSKNDIIKLHSWGIAVGTPLGGLLGAGVGALLPTGGWNDVYRAH